MVKRIVPAVIIIICCVVMLTGCQTMEGFGKDLKKLGDRIEKSADKKNRYLNPQNGAGFYK